MYMHKIDIIIKCIVVGDSSCGKTSFINRIIDNKFVENVMKDIRKSKMIIYNYEILSSNKNKARIGGNLRNLIEKLYDEAQSLQQIKIFK